MEEQPYFLEAHKEGRLTKDLHDLLLCSVNRAQHVLKHGVKPENSGQFGVELEKAYRMESDQPVLDNKLCPSPAVSSELQ